MVNLLKIDKKNKIRIIEGNYGDYFFGLIRRENRLRNLGSAIYSKPPFSKMKIIHVLGTNKHNVT